MEQDTLKTKVAAYWQKEACGTSVAISAKFSKEYWEEIESYRYEVEPEIFSFAQFTRFYGKRVLEVGVGAGTDFLQWIKAGAIAYGIDLTEEAIEHVKERVRFYGLSAQDMIVADAEKIPYPTDFFDLVYSWGVIHHSPSTIRALQEIIRVTKPGGSIKIMIYNRHSLLAFYYWLLFGPLRGRPFRSVSDVLYHHMESLGTKAYTVKEIKKILLDYPVTIKKITTTATNYDLNPFLKNQPILIGAAYLLAFICGYNNCGWYITLEITKGSN